MEQNYFTDDPLVAYKANLAQVLHCLLWTDEGEENRRGNDSGVVELLASTLRLHLRKQQAFNEYVQQTSARLVAVDVRDNDNNLPTITTNTAIQRQIAAVTDDDDDLIRRRRLLMECFQGVNLHYSSYTQQRPTPPPSPTLSQIGPSL
ncbi:Uncharacterized protein APZ42_030539 [Daphnia magna]|uniref:Uncharacterized protein n=2 Tax=Daphnia magna TaxID=35525 RepID=A0A0P4YQ02_9CRUS|nr:hypothetical protein OUZ56_001282 [Daphnia magna]KZS06030.1 Uncharacterized protein APZ42_030539 [Daphnia magna]